MTAVGVYSIRLDALDGEVLARDRSPQDVWRLLIACGWRFKRQVGRVIVVERIAQ